MLSGEMRSYAEKTLSDAEQFIRELAVIPAPYVGYTGISVLI